MTGPRRCAPFSFAYETFALLFLATMFLAGSSELLVTRSNLLALAEVQVGQFCCLVGQPAAYESVRPPAAGSGCCWLCSHLVCFVFSLCMRRPAFLPSGSVKCCCPVRSLFRFLRHLAFSRRLLCLTRRLNRRSCLMRPNLEREVHNESRRRNYYANREAILVKNRELRALGRAAKQALDAREPNQDGF